MSSEKIIEKNIDDENVSRSIWTIFIKIFSTLFGLIVSIFISWAISILIETAGMTFFWEDEGFNRSLDILKTEISYVSNDKRDELVGEFYSTVNLSDIAYRWAIQKTGINDLFSTLGDYGAAYRNTSMIFFIRLAVIESILVLFVLITIWGFIEGLLIRSLRRWNGDVERSFVFRRIKELYKWLIVLPIPIYLMLPIAIHPMFIAAPFFIIYIIVVLTLVGFFKTIL